jgi:hypothetical protein
MELQKILTETSYKVYLFWKGFKVCKSVFLQRLYPLDIYGNDPP